MTYTAPTVTKLHGICEASELPMNVRTFVRRNSRHTSELLTLSIFENHCNRVRVFEVSELPTHVETPNRRKFDLRRNSRHSVHLKTVVGLWSGMTTTMNSPNYLNCESSELPTITGASDRQNSRRTNPRTTTL